MWQIVSSTICTPSSEKEVIIMSGKFTDDIIMKVGQGIMRIPRDAEAEEKTTFPQSQNRANAHSELLDHKGNLNDSKSSGSSCAQKK